MRYWLVPSVKDQEIFRTNLTNNNKPLTTQSKPLGDIYEGIPVTCILNLQRPTDWHLKVHHESKKISDDNFESRFDDSFIISKFIKTKSQILVSSLNTKNVCEKLVARN